MSRAGNQDEGGALIRGKSLEIYGATYTKVQELVQFNNEGAKNAKMESGRIFQSNSLYSNVIMIAAFIIAIAIAYWIIRDIKKSITELALNDSFVQHFKVSIFFH